jgi:mevalonate kinase
MSCNFETTAYSKFILLGEHAVIRGHPAIAFPDHNHKMILRYAPQKELTLSDSQIKPVIDYAIKILNLQESAVNGNLNITSNIPISSGMGSSAALCIVITRWLKWLTKLDIDIINFAKNLEDIFHGKSSGLDVAVIEKNKPIFFQNGQIIELEPAWRPNIRVFRSEIHSQTRDAVAKVQELFKTNRNFAEEIDSKMDQAVILARSALEVKDAKLDLSKAIKQAADCFYNWNLVPPELAEVMNKIYKLGALAVKPTGSGAGGNLIALFA